MPALASMTVDELMTHAPVSLETVMPRIERLFEHVEPLLVERFPGPLWTDPRRTHARVPRGSEISGIAACLVALGARAVPAVLRLLGSSRSDQRCAAAFVAGELPFAPVVESLGALALHADPSTRLAALTVLPDLGLAPGARQVIERIRKSASWAQTSDIRVAAIQALEELRDAHSVPMLVGFLSESDIEIAELARHALLRITARAFGPLRWKLWLRTNAKRARFHWLLDALRQWNGELRSLAADELIRLTGHGKALAPNARRSEAKGLEAHYLQYWAEEMRQLGDARS
jgi:hypothetical protein